MSFHVPKNQSLSWSVWHQAVTRKFNMDDVEPFRSRMMIWFDAGETVDGAIELLEMFIDGSKQAAALDMNKSPLSLAKRVVKFG